MAQRTRRVHLTPLQRQAAMEAALRASAAPSIELADDDLLDDVSEADIIREDVETLEAGDHLEWTSVDCDLGELGLAQLEAAALEASAREAAKLEAARAAALPPASSTPASLPTAALPLPPARRAAPSAPAPRVTEAAIAAAFAPRASEPPPASASAASSFRQEWKGTPRTALGKETLQVLAPLMVKQLARPSAPPPRFPRSAGLLAAAAAIAAVLLTASAAMAWT
jgi:hypothetical protein